MKLLIQKRAHEQLGRVPHPTRKVAIMVPVASLPITADEEVSLRQLRKHLDHYDKYLLVPRGMRISWEGFNVIELDRRHFGSAARHNRMLYQPEFWLQFGSYEYVLMYHLDALVFSDQLDDWCHRGFDFVGAPFLHCGDSPWVRRERVGNGGFALYRVAAVLQVLWRRYLEDPGKYYEDHYPALVGARRKLLDRMRQWTPDCLKSCLGWGLRGKLRAMNFVEANDMGNDGFWADAAGRYLPGFRIPSVEDGLRFAFEVAPRSCLERNGGAVPFGCHAWGRYDREFWLEIMAGGLHSGDAGTSLVREYLRS